MMKVGMYYNNTDVRVQEMPVPETGPDDILIKIMASGICGSDILEWYRIKRAPLVLGHEITGEIVKTGSSIKGFKPADRVFTTHHVPCNICQTCLKGHETACEVFQTQNNHFPGGFSQYLRISGRSTKTGTFHLPRELSYEQGTFIEPLGTAVRCMRTADIKPGDSVLVLGSGIGGILNIKLARALGAGNVMATDITDFRLEAAEKAGASSVFNGEDDIASLVKKSNNGRLADRVIICTGAVSALKQGFSSIEKGGTAVLFAVPKPGQTLPVDFNPYWRNDISIKTSYGAAPVDNIQAMELLRSGNVAVDDMITHRIPLSDIQKAFELASSGKDCLKIIINPW